MQRRKRLLVFGLLPLLLAGCAQTKDRSKQIEVSGQTAERFEETESQPEEERFSEAESQPEKESKCIPEGEARTETEGDTEAGAEEQAADAPQTLHFVDAWGEWHDAVMNPRVLKHSYDWDKLGREGELVTYEGDPRFTLRQGVDVSKYQGIIDWQQVREDGIDFAIVRIGFRGYGAAGKIKADEFAIRNMEEAQKAGIEVGVYFFSQAINEEEAVEEAEFVIELLEGRSLQLPVVYDPELIRGDEARTDGVSGTQFTDHTIAFCERIKEAGYQPMVYSNMVWEAELFELERLQEYPIWYADYEPLPQTPYQFVIWQYTEKGQVAGISGQVDRNVWFVPSQDDRSLPKEDSCEKSEQK